MNIVLCAVCENYPVYSTGKGDRDTKGPGIMESEFEFLGGLGLDLHLSTSRNGAGVGARGLCLWSPVYIKSLLSICQPELLLVLTTGGGNDRWDYLAASGEGKKGTGDRRGHPGNTLTSLSHTLVLTVAHIFLCIQHPVGKLVLSIFSRPVHLSEHQGSGGAWAITRLPYKEQ